MRRDYAALGDWICVEGDCQIGRALVNQMQIMYTALANTAGSMFIAKFQPIVQAITQSLDDADTWAARWVPFHPGCCTIKSIGNQAQDVMRQMAQATGTVTPSQVDTKGPTEKILGEGLEFVDILKLGITAYIAVQIYKELK